MATNKLTPEQQQRFLRAGHKALALRRQLAVTWLASEEIIRSMRALREGIPLPEKRIDDSTD
jgi:D-hexose-6-phosphate mutarotase